jgi:hypothetical protein
MQDFLIQVLPKGPDLGVGEPKVADLRVGDPKVVDLGVGEPEVANLRLGERVQEVTEPSSADLRDRKKIESK